jgi:UDP-N-acetylglucosamine 2-epimerase (non-hydrolysing)
LTDISINQEETTYLGTPCFALRPNTEHPITVTQENNQLCKIDTVENKIVEILSRSVRDEFRIDFRDGKTAERNVQSIKSKF